MFRKSIEVSVKQNLKLTQKFDNYVSRQNLPDTGYNTNYVI
jgi:hypothetical protein